jgi:hypothetical protein
MYLICCATLLLSIYLSGCSSSSYFVLALLKHFQGPLLAGTATLQDIPKLLLTGGQSSDDGDDSPPQERLMDSCLEGIVAYARTLQTNANITVAIDEGGMDQEPPHWFRTNTSPTDYAALMSLRQIRRTKNERRKRCLQEQQYKHQRYHFPGGAAAGVVHACITTAKMIIFSPNVAVPSNVIATAIHPFFPNGEEEKGDDEDVNNNYHNSNRILVVGGNCLLTMKLLLDPLSWTRSTTDETAADSSTKITPTTTSMMVSRELVFEDTPTKEPPPSCTEKNNDDENGCIDKNTTKHKTYRGYYRTTSGIVCLMGVISIVCGMVLFTTVTTCDYKPWTLLTTTHPFIEKLMKIITNVQDSSILPLVVVDHHRIGDDDDDDGDFENTYPGLYHRLLYDGSIDFKVDDGDDHLTIVEVRSFCSPEAHEYHPGGFNTEQNNEISTTTPLSLESKTIIEEGKEVLQRDTIPSVEDLTNASAASFAVAAATPSEGDNDDGENDVVVDVHVAVSVVETPVDYHSEKDVLSESSAPPMCPTTTIKGENDLLSPTNCRSEDADVGTFPFPPVVVVVVVDHEDLLLQLDMDNDDEDTVTDSASSDHDILSNEEEEAEKEADEHNIDNIQSTTIRTTIHHETMDEGKSDHNVTLSFEPSNDGGVLLMVRQKEDDNERNSTASIIKKQQMQIHPCISDKKHPAVDRVLSRLRRLLQKQERQLQQTISALLQRVVELVVVGPYATLVVTIKHANMLDWLM